MNRGNLKKTIYYLRRNGIKNTWFAIWERLAACRQPLYCFVPPGEEELERQRAACRESEPVHRISIVVPCYHTAEKHLLEMMDSVLRQTYPVWELILVDATEDDSVERVVRTVTDSRIRYIRLAENAGIAENTNRGIEMAVGDYVGLLDHDDLLTQDALFQMADVISQRDKRKKKTLLLYSDEDKCDGDGKGYFDPNLKEDFNLDLLLSNNYICHFMVLERKLIQELLLRREYEGAQDYDLALRAAAKLAGQEDGIVHIPKVLYHWRCHVGSTAENPQSKLYAYEAGGRAIQDFADRAGWRAKAVETAHLGFYVLRYEGNLFESRKDVGAVGGALVRKGRIVSGRLDKEGSPVYGNLPVNYSGYLHRAVLPQNAFAVDIRNLRIRRECRDLFKKITGVSYKEIPGTDTFDTALLPDDCDVIQMSLKLCEALTAAGYRILYLPELTKKL